MSNPTCETCTWAERQGSSLHMAGYFRAFSLRCGNAIADAHRSRVSRGFCCALYEPLTDEQIEWYTDHFNPPRVGEHTPQTTGEGET